MLGMRRNFGRGQMHWRQFFRVRQSLRSSLWTVPIIAIPFAMFATRLAHWLDAQIQWTFLGFGVKGAEALLQATATATLSFLVFTFGSLLVALQVASGQLTPRIIATTLLRNNVVRYTVGTAPMLVAIRSVDGERVPKMMKWGLIPHTGQKKTSFNIRPSTRVQRNLRQNLHFRMRGCVASGASLLLTDSTSGKSLMPKES
jgi:Predicted membrane protein (DUF2254)